MAKANKGAPKGSTKLSGYHGIQGRNVRALGKGPKTATIVVAKGSQRNHSSSHA